MSKLTKQQWQEVEERLKQFFSPVYLNCDGYKVTLVLERVDQFNNAIRLYVDGVFRGKWLLKKDDAWCEEARRFLPLRTKARYSEKEKKQLIRVFGKKDAREKFNIDGRIEGRQIFWKAFGPLKRHFIANNETIELVTDEQTTTS
ncbi:MAG: hypothetical protein RRB22_01265 [Gammaproteobacteria bacterium]|nr:hypothetical protein [Gammaproteobacteria bacterium]